ncbi:hypothetical protein ACROYT_G030231 [Oculina patagonica]
MTTANRGNRSFTGRAGDRDLNKIVYHFDSTRPWQYFVRGQPIASSVEKGKRKLTSSRKLQKIYVSKDKRKIIRRKNAAFNDVNSLQLTCCHSGCLLRQGLLQTRILIRDQRNMVYQKSYNEQKYLFARLLEIKVTMGGKRSVTYTIPTLGKPAWETGCYGVKMPPKFVNVRRIMLKHKRGSKCPFLERFLDEVIDTEQRNFLSSENIYQEYARLVALWTHGDSVSGQTKHLMKKATFFRLHGVPSDPRGAGICAFASRDIHKNEIICEYEGEVVTEVEARAREVLYREQGKACALMVLESGGRQIAIDPYRGNALTDLPWGATLNHSRNKPNVKPFVANRNTDNPRVFLVALYDIAQTVELLWDYNDSEWALYSNSQTLL